eukprot:Skav227259  [mRNA]  locus=scaffold101:35290:35979:+ [translate_table: standard]
MQAVDWGNHTEKGIPIDEFCFKCSDICGRIRPLMTKEQALEAYSQRRDSEANTLLADEFDEAAAKFDEMESDMLPFMPSSAVQTKRDVGIEIYQEYGLVDEGEFYRLVGITPKAANKKPSPFPAPTPSADGKRMNRFLFSLRGLPADEIAAMTKIKVFFHDSAEFSKHYLAARDQLLQNQGQYVFSFALAKTEKLDIPAKPDSFADILTSAKKKKNLACYPVTFSKVFG